MLLRAFIMLLMLLSTATVEAADTRKKLQDVETALQQKKEAAEQAERAAGSSSAEVKLIQEQLRQAAKDESEQQGAFDALTAEMEDLRAKAATAKTALQESAQRQAGALGMMLRLAQLPAAAWWLYDGISLDQERRMLLLGGAARGLEAQADRLRQAIAAVDLLQKQLEAKQAEVVAAKAKLQERVALLNTMIAERQKLAREHRAAFSNLQQEVTKLASAASDLRSLLDKMAAMPHPKPATPGTAAEAEARDAGEDEASLMPVSGRIARTFGSKDTYGITSRGLTLTAKAGTRIVAPMGGKAVFVGPFKGYGTIVILQHAGGLHSLLAGFGKVDLELGQKVLAGEPIGQVAAGKNGAAGEIYFELRRNGEPINPQSVKKPQS